MIIGQSQMLFWTMCRHSSLTSEHDSRSRGWSFWKIWNWEGVLANVSRKRNVALTITWISEGRLSILRKSNSRLLFAATVAVFQRFRWFQTIYGGTLRNCQMYVGQSTFRQQLHRPEHQTGSRLANFWRPGLTAISPVFLHRLPQAILFSKWALLLQDLGMLFAHRLLLLKSTHAIKQRRVYYLRRLIEEDILRSLVLLSVNSPQILVGACVCLLPSVFNSCGHKTSWWLNNRSHWGQWWSFLFSCTVFMRVYKLWHCAKVESYWSHLEGWVIPCTDSTCFLKLLFLVKALTHT